jgi:hypothetical protein
MLDKQGESKPMSMAQTTDIAYVGSCIVMAMFQPLLHIRMGKRALSWYGPVALLAMIGIAEFCRCGLILAYAFVWLIACFIQMFLRDKSRHSKDIGDPLLCCLTRSWNSGVMLEACVLMGLGFVFPAVDMHFAGLLWMGGLGIAIRQAIEQTARREEIRLATDAAIEARNRGEAFRG